MTHLPPDDRPASLLHSRLMAGLVSLLLTMGVAAADFAIGAEALLFPFYLLPLEIVTWFVGHRWGIAFGVLIPVMSLLVERREHVLGVPDLWNAAMWCGVCLCFCLLLGQIQSRDGGLRAVSSMHRTVIGTTVVACVLVAAGLILQQDSLARQGVRFTRQGEAPVVSPMALPGSMDGARASRLVGRFIARMSALRSSSRPILLGSRDPNGPSCVTPVLSGEITDQIPVTQGDFDGGPGTRMGVLYMFDRRLAANPQHDFTWHQTRLRVNLENQAALNRPALALASQLATDAAALAAAVKGWTTWPADFTAREYNPHRDWPGACLAQLTQSIRSRDLAGTRRWSAEYAAALFALEDLHRWLGFLIDNHLAALDFQRDCEGLFTDETLWVEPYNILVDVGNLPAGILGLNGISNYFEVERQAESLFATVAPEAVAAQLREDPVAESIWMPPVVRAQYQVLGQELTGANREHWRRAPRTPYERSYLVNMLYRASVANALVPMRDVLRRFNTANPGATLQQLMDVMMYRGHSLAGIEWGDRYQSALMSAATTLGGTDLEAFQKSSRLTGDFRQQGTYGVANTLREALVKKELDCIRATDMIGTIYRNAGRSRFGHIRWCAGSSGHSVAAYVGRDGDKPRTLILDGLDFRPQPEVWPDAYFQGHRWPAGLERNAPPYSAELYVRGLDNYVWAEGYIIRGPNAGTLVKTTIPFQPIRVEKSSRRVFAGPYPR